MVQNTEMRLIMTDVLLKRPTPHTDLIRIHDQQPRIAMSTQNEATCDVKE